MLFKSSRAGVAVTPMYTPLFPINFSIKSFIVVFSPLFIFAFGLAKSASSSMMTLFLKVQILSSSFFKSPEFFLQKIIHSLPPMVTEGSSISF